MKKNIAVSQHRQKADFILRNAKIADVFSLKWKEADLVVANGKIIALDTEGKYEAEKVEDARGRWVIPGMIDTQIHIESTMLTPEQFSRIILPFGVTSVIADPHEIANVSGTEGLKYMLDAAKDSPLDIYYMLPSSVPATSFEHAGAVLKASDLAPFLKNEQVLGIAEVMDYPAVLSCDEEMLAKIQLGHEHGMMIDGHGAGLNGQQLAGYRAAGIHTDHECITLEEALERIEMGMYVLVREGSASKNLKALLPAITPYNARRFAFCTDDKHLDEIIQEGTINHSVKLAIAEGIEVLQAIQLATLNAAECYRLYDKGAVAPGFTADFVLLDDLEEMKIAAVWKNGVKVAEDGEMLLPETAPIDVPARICHSVHLPEVKVDDLALPLKSSFVNIIGIIPNQIVTKKLQDYVDVQDGKFVPNIEKDFLKLAVFERHLHRGTKSVAIVHGLGLKAGAIATTIAHDSHNVIAVGTNDKDMVLALNEIQAIQGGLVVVKDGKVLANLELPVAGLMTNIPAREAAEKLRALHDALHELNPTLHFHLFLTLSFLSLPVIPALKLTDTGLFDVEQFRHIPIEAEQPSQIKISS